MTQTNPPVTEEAVERVARAIVAAIKSDCTKPDGRCYAVGDIDAMEVDGEFDPEAIARAAIAALKSPPVVSEGMIEFDDAAGVAYTIAKLREELDELYRREPPKDAPKVRPGRLYDVGVSVISRLQHIDHLQRYQIAFLERQLADALNPPRHKFWGAGEADCPREIKAGNGELHTLRCKVCGLDDPRDDRCLAPLAMSVKSEATQEGQ